MFNYRIIDKIPLPELIRRVRWYINMRWLYLLVLSLAGIVPEYILLGWEPLLWRDIAALASGFAINGLLMLLALRNNSRRYFLALSGALVFIDTLLASYLVYSHGGLQSRLVILYVLPMILAGTLLGRLAIYLSALLSAGLYALTLLAISSHVLPAVQLTNTEQTLLIVPILFYASVFGIIALLTDFAAGFNRQHEMELAKEEMISLTSHQLRTPATAVKGALAILLENTKLPGVQAELLRIAYKENERELHIIDTLLAVARVHSGELRLEIQRVDLARLLIDAGEYQRPVLGQRKQHLVLTIPNDPAWVEVDANMLGMAIDNLMSNASKYSGLGAKISLSLKHGRKTWLISVKDTGIGMRHRDRQKLFRKYTRLVSPISGSTAGSGLGLYLVKQIVDLHNGKITLKTSPGKGSMFTIVLPAKE